MGKGFVEVCARPSMRLPTIARRRKRYKLYNRFEDVRGSRVLRGARYRRSMLIRSGRMNSLVNDAFLGTLITLTRTQNRMKLR